jgi:spore coat protein U-like protein
MKKLLILTTVLGAVALSGTAMAADTASVAVTGRVTEVCKFTGSGTVAFGGLDPSNAGPVDGTVGQPTFWCTKGASYTIADNKGLHASGSTFQMKHATLADLIPYSFTYKTTGLGTGPATPLTLNIAASVIGADYMNKSSGDYADTVTLSINP